MRTAACTAVLLAIAIAAIAQNTDAEAREFARSIDNAIAKRNAASLEKMLGDGFEFVHSTGRVEDRASYIRRAGAGQLASQAQPGNVIEDRIQIHRDTAIRTTLTEVRLPTDVAGTSTQIYTRYVYVKSGAGWSWISAQSTVVAKPLKP